MPDALEMTQVILVRLGELLRKLPPEVVTDLYEGTARLEVVPKGGRQPRKAKTQAAPPVDPQQIEADLAKIDDRAAAIRYVNDLKFTATQLKALAGSLNIPVGSKAKKDDIILEIVKWTVGKRLQAEAISRPPSL